MLSVNMDAERGIAILEPHGPLSAEDFSKASKAIDPYIEEHGKLNGVIIHTGKFPGWESFDAFISHFRFVKDHHKQLSKIALVTDAKIGDLAEKIGNHFTSAEIKHYPFDHLNSAQFWIASE